MAQLARQVRWISLRRAQVIAEMKEATEQKAGMQPIYFFIPSVARCALYGALESGTSVNHRCHKTFNGKLELPWSTWGLLFLCSPVFLRCPNKQRFFYRNILNFWNQVTCTALPCDTYRDLCVGTQSYADAVRTQSSWWFLSWSLPSLLIQTWDSSFCFCWDWTQVYEVHLSCHSQLLLMMLRKVMQFFF